MTTPNDMAATGFQIAYVTAANADEAAQIARALIEDRLAACANVTPSVRSFYRWEGQIADDEEAVIVLKTHQSRSAALIERVRELHSYDVPCVVLVPLVDGNPEYLDWLTAELDLEGRER